MSSRGDKQFEQELFEQELYRILQGEGAVRRKEPMKNHTTFRAGGPAEYFVCPENSRELAELLKLCRQKGFPWFILGNGSNLLVSDRGFDGLVIAMEEGFSRIQTEGTSMTAGAGVLLSQMARKACEAGLTGLEFAAGIPGTLGGGTVMNAGAYGSELKDVLEWVKIFDTEGREILLPAADLELGYRTSRILQKGYVVLEAGLSLKKGKPEDIRRRMEELAAARREKQPLEYPSAGSTFKRPPGYFAGKLIQDAGLRGKQMGGAQVSEKHCGFVINRDNASAEDIWKLCRFVTEKVREQFHVELEMEVKLLGDFPGKTENKPEDFSAETENNRRADE